MPLTYDPALVARMLRNLRSACKGQADNRRSLVGTQRSCRASSVKIGLTCPGRRGARTGRGGATPGANGEAAPM